VLGGSSIARYCLTCPLKRRRTVPRTVGQIPRSQGFRVAVVNVAVVDMVGEEGTGDGDLPSRDVLGRGQVHSWRAFSPGADTPISVSLVAVTGSVSGSHWSR
jgi:hypothetical protein